KARRRPDPDSGLQLPLRQLRVEELDPGRGRHERGRARDDGHRLSAALSLFGRDRQRHGLRVLALGHPAVARGRRIGRFRAAAEGPDHSHLTQTLQHARHSCEPVATSSYGAYDAETTARGLSLLRRRGEVETDVAEGSFRTDDKTRKGQGTL